MTMNNDPAILDDCIALLQKHVATFPRSDTLTQQTTRAVRVVLELSMDYAIQTAQWMCRILHEGPDGAVLACTLLRSFYENSVRVLWASTETDGWKRLFAYYALEKEKWANKALNSQNTEIVALAQNELQWCQHIKSWRDSNGNPFSVAPDIQKLLDDIEAHEAQNSAGSSNTNWGRRYYTFLYRILCRASHAHLEAITGEVNSLYVSTAYIGALTASTNLLQAFIHHSSASAQGDIIAMLNEFRPLLCRCACLHAP